MDYTLAVYKSPQYEKLVRFRTGFKLIETKRVIRASI